MKAHPLSTLAAAATLLALPQTTGACGDKLTMMGGGVSFDAVGYGAHPARIVLYIAPDSSLHATRTSTQKKLERAGHKVSMADSAGGLQRALRNGTFDVLLTSLADERAAAPVATGTDVPAMLSIVYRPTPASVTPESAAVTCTTRVDKGNVLLDAIDNVVVSKGRNLRADCTPADGLKST